ncbi:MAG TPA: helix-turn-helix domain-containing protein [Solirubrobacteraceae bacterium]|nr:helix-turn-helix domain-containing protein [Solirubrobacteraceae bacterium]
MNTSTESISQGNAHRFHACSVDRALQILGDRWTFLILRESFFGVRRYGELARNLGCSRTILTVRLRRLVDAGVMSRDRYRTDPDRFEYRLTKAGIELYPAIVALMHWADQHLTGPEGPPLLLHHLPCDGDSTPLLVCSGCGEPMHAHEMRPHPGPGASDTA